ncbi:MAG: hypothetical protein LBS69_12290 [Prevotellaceae bacterium]|jgi:hypothetical protein|nr:hypothetical protein [Prevotellaceae bacterium]
MEDIKKWLESKTPDYTTGVLLFNKYSKNRAIAQWLVRVGEKRGMSKLVYELRRILEKSPNRKFYIPKLRNEEKPTLAQNPAEFKQKPIIIDIEGRIKRENLPEQLRVLYDENVEKYKILRGAHASLEQEKHQRQRKKLRRQIAELDDKIAKNWEAIDHWAVTQELPGDENITPGGAGKLTPQQVNSYRTYISRTIANPDKIDDKKHATAQERITALISDGQAFDEITVEKLNALGFNTQSNISSQN